MIISPSITDIESEQMPTYDINESYEWNYQRGPIFTPELSLKRRIPPQEKFLDFRLNSRFGIPAGLLLNSKWVRLYAELGFDLLTYKTVRTKRHESFLPPNVLPVYTKAQITPDRLSEELIGSLNFLPDIIENLSITNSFGVPSENPSEWQPDVERSKQHLAQGQLLIVSVVGTFEKEQTKDSFIKDFTHCAMLAKEAGADAVELNLSCPNSPSEEGTIYKDCGVSEEIARSVRSQIKETPLFLKIGYFESIDLLQEMVKSTAPLIDGIVGINTVKMAVIDTGGKPALPGVGREKVGICGAAIKKCGLETCRHLVELREREKYDYVVIGVGGAMTPSDIDDYLATGANAVQSCTAAMWNPHLAIEYYLEQFKKRVWRKGKLQEIVDYSQRGMPELIDLATLDRQRRGEIMILFPIRDDTATCPACGAKLVDVLHEFRSYRYCARCKDAVPA